MLAASQHARHTLLRPVLLHRDGKFASEGSDKTATAAFFKFTRQILPKMQQNIEYRLIKQFTRKMSREEKDQVVQSWVMRKDNLGRIEDDASPHAPPLPRTPILNFEDCVLDYEG